MSELQRKSKGCRVIAICNQKGGVTKTSAISPKNGSGIAMQNKAFMYMTKPCHNAVMESFFSSMKKEELYRTNYRSVNEFKEHIRKYIYFYNNDRPHITLHYKSPNVYERGASYME